MFHVPANERVCTPAQVLYVHTQRGLCSWVWTLMFSGAVNFCASSVRRAALPPSLHMGPSCLLCASRLRPLQATRGYFCGALVAFDCNLFRATSQNRRCCSLDNNNFSSKYRALLPEMFRKAFSLTSMTYLPVILEMLTTCKLT